MTAGLPVAARKAAAADYDRAQAAHHAAYRDMIVAAFGVWDEAAQDQYFREGWNPDTFEILLWQDQFCGDTAVEDRGDHLYVDELVIHPDYQNRGIGTAALRAIMDRAEQLGVPVRLQTRHVNRARHLYRKVGFREIGQTVTHVLFEWP